MPGSLVEKYALILAADPKSRVFVELARALVEAGDLRRCAEVCRQGLEHHPDSIQGRLVWARALLLAHDIAGAMAQLDLAMAIEPQSPYAYNLAADLLVEHGMHSRALPILERAAALQPGNEKIRGRLDETRRAARPDPDPSAGFASRREPPVLERLGRTPRADQTLELHPPVESAGGATSTSTPSEAADSAAPNAERPARPTLRPGEWNLPDTSASRRFRLGETLELPAPGKANGAAPGTAQAGSRDLEAAGVSSPAPPPLWHGGAAKARPEEDEERDVTHPGFALSHLPDEAPPTAARAAPAAAPDVSEAERIASEYESELRNKLSGPPQPPPGFWHRHWVGVLAAAVGGLGLAAAGATYHLVRRHHRADEVRADIESARKGLARDTAGALREAARVLGEARELDPSSREALSLSAQVAALLWADHGDAAARDLARDFAASGRAGEGALVARYLLAATPAERAGAAEPLATAPLRAGPLVQVLAAEAMAARGRTQTALERFELAAQATPPMLRALADLGDLYRRRGDLDQALGYYRAALAAHPTHPRAAIGAAEVRFALGRDLDASLRDLKAVEADPGSAPAGGDRVRFELALARLLATSGDRAAAAERLDRAAEKLGAHAEVAAAIAEIHTASGAYDKAEAEAQRAVRQAPQEAAYRLLLARAQAGRGHYRELIQASQGHESRELRLWRGIARYELGEYREAAAELDQTRRDGKMPAEAASYYALAEFAAGREAQARALLRRLTSLRSAPAVAFVASGQLEMARGRRAAAEQHLRAALQRDPAVLEGNCALGRLFLRAGRGTEALPFLEKAARANPFHGEARIALARARLGGGDARAARQELEGFLASEPRNAEALSVFAAAALADRDPAAARAAAERAISARPGSPDCWLAASRAALAQGDARAARRYAERALKLARGPRAAEAKRVLAEAKARR